MTKHKWQYSSLLTLCCLLIFLINGLLLWHEYSNALLILFNICCALWLIIFWYHNNTSQQHTVNLIDTLLISLREGDYTIRANEESNPKLATTVNYVNQLAETMQNDQRLLAEQQALLNQIIESVDFALVVFNPDKCVFANQYAIQNFKDVNDQDVWSWYIELKQTVNQDKVTQILDGQQHTFLLENTQCFIGAQAHQLVVLKQLDSILYQQEKDALQKFVRILSHEINNTLAPIGTVARSLTRRLERDIDHESFHTGLTLINERANYLKSFMDNYASLAKLPNTNKQAESCDDLCTDIQAIYPNLIIEKQNNLMGFFDKGQVKQVLCHLINNSFEASNQEVNVILKVLLVNNKVKFSISDSGPGFSNIEEASTAFYTTKSNGNGIGLMLSRIIIDNHGSKLKLENIKPSGAKVSFVLELISP